MQHLGIDWGTRRTNWCAIDEHGALQEGAVPADQDGLSRLALTLDTSEVHGCIEMMSGAVWVRDRLAWAATGPVPAQRCATARSPAPRTQPG
jgi:hypothetical protein